MILELGEEINRLKNELHAFAGLMTEFRVTGPDGRKREPQWKESLIRIADEPSHQALVQIRSEQLQAAIPPEASGSVLIQALHDFFLEEASAHSGIMI
ncbi:MAG: hypothetical protein M3O31_04755 [Acidobacteriota bacterium]|nr:hypothetical protein [Acidobacteriota bacterium]